MEASEHSLACHDLCCGYGGSVVLGEVEMEIAPGTISAILGPNGCGKSTLLKTICGAIAPVEGYITIGRDRADTLSTREIARRIAFVPPEEEVEFPFLVREIVAMGRLPHSEGLFDTKEDQRITEESMRLAECDHVADRPITEVSAGERQRALLARSLAQQTKILLLDEPTSHLDPGHQMSFGRLIQSLAKSGYTILAAVHDLNLAGSFADDAFLICEGRIVTRGSVADVLASPALDEAYRVKFERTSGSSGRQLLFPTP